MDVNFNMRTEIADLSDSDIEAVSQLLAKAFHEKLINNIRSNKFGYVLSSATDKARSFRKHTLSTPLVETGSYVDSIVFRDGIVSILETSVDRSGLTMQELSDILEYGRPDKGFSGFPHWRPTLEEFMPQAERIILDYIDKNCVKPSNRKA